MPYIYKVDRKKFAEALELIENLKISAVHMRKIFTYLAATKLKAVDELTEERLEKDIGEAALAPILSIKELAMNSGDLNYFFTSVMVIYIKQNLKKYNVLETLAGVLAEAKDQVLKDNKMSTFTELSEDEKEELRLVVKGLFSCCSDELYRVITGPYEDEKMADPKNGPVVDDVAALGKSKSY